MYNVLIQGLIHFEGEFIDSIARFNDLHFTIPTKVW